MYYPIVQWLIGLCVQGLPSQRATSNSSILACLNVIKTTSLIISCTKHLHNSFCLHFDALWCILMHSEHLRKKLTIFWPKKCNFSNWNFMHKTLILFILHTFWCISMHSDAYWCILSTWNKISYFCMENRQFYQSICNKNHLFDYFVHKTFAQFVLLTFWCTLMHFDAFWCILMHFDALWCTLMHFDAYWLNLSWILMHIWKCIKMHWCASKCISVHQNASNVCRMNCSDVMCTNWTKKWFLFHLIRVKCIIMHLNASICIGMH